MASATELMRLRAYMRAGQDLTGWIAAAKALALLKGAIDCGLVEAIRAKRTPEEIAEATGIGKDRLAALLVALEVHRVVGRDGECYRLTPRYTVLADPTAPIPLRSLVQHTAVMAHTLETIAGADIGYTVTSPQDILAVAEGSGISALSSAPHVGQETSAKIIPEVESMWRVGAHHLEVGCGVGNNLLGTAVTYPNVTAVGIEIDRVTAAEAARRARMLGVADRVEVRTMDACDLQDKAAFDTIQWSQLFFPDSVRPVVLRAMRRALKPGGLLFMPWYASVSEHEQPSRLEMLRIGLRAMGSGEAWFAGFFNDVLGDTPRRRDKVRRAAALTRLVFGKWGVRPRTLDELAAEVAAGGFTVVRAEPLPVNPFVLSRGLLLARVAAD
jgi:SAM-dependent methyltransferase